MRGCREQALSRVAPNRAAIRSAVIGGCVVGFVAGVDVIGGIARWPRAGTSLQFEVRADGTDSGTAWFVFPGLGQRSSVPAARALAPALDAPVVSLRLPERGPFLKPVGRAAHAFVAEHGIKKARLYCSSMGNYLAADILAYLPPRLQVDKVIFDCSPGHIEQAKQGARVPRLASQLRYPGGILTKPLAAALSYQPHPDHPGQVTLGDYAREIWGSVAPNSNGSSPMLWVWQVQRLCHQDTARLVRALQSRLTDDARLAYIMPDPPERDRVVDVVSSAHLLEQALGRSITRLPIEGISHSWPVEYAPRYQETVARWLGDRALSPGYLPARTLAVR
jgi:pimeloyl-ACP methyl ester carboxylesterase